MRVQNSHFCVCSKTNEIFKHCKCEGIISSPTFDFAIKNSPKKWRKFQFYSCHCIFQTRWLNMFSPTPTRLFEAIIFVKLAMLSLPHFMLSIFSLFMFLFILSLAFDVNCHKRCLSNMQFAKFIWIYHRSLVSIQHFDSGNLRFTI